MDKITLERIKLIHPKYRDEVFQIYEEICKELTGDAFCRFTHTYRDEKTQNALYAQGRTAPGSKVTNARWLESEHNFGIAVDIAMIYNNGKSASWDTTKDWDKDGVADWLEVVKIFNKYNWKWGFFNSKGQRYDLPHFGKVTGYTVAQLRNKYKKGDVFIDNGIKYVNI